MYSEGSCSWTMRLLKAFQGILNNGSTVMPAESSHVREQTRGELRCEQLRSGALKRRRALRWRCDTSHRAVEDREENLRGSVFHPRRLSRPASCPLSLPTRALAWDRSCFARRPVSCAGIDPGGTSPSTCRRVAPLRRRSRPTTRDHREAIAFRDHSSATSDGTLRAVQLWSEDARRPRDRLRRSGVRRCPQSFGHHSLASTYVPRSGLAAAAAKARRPVSRRRDTDTGFPR